MRSLLPRLSLWKATNNSSLDLYLRHGSIKPPLLHRLLPFLFKDASISRMDIRKDRFPYHLIRLLNDIADSHFIAFDFEFSGIKERNRERAGKPTLQEHYEETRASVHEFQPLQIGLTIVKLDEDKGMLNCFGNSSLTKAGRYVLEPYNLDISPLPALRERHFTRKWSMHSGAVSFLQRNGFDFGKQMIHGIPYLSTQEESRARNNMTIDAKREDMQVKPDDQLLVQYVRDSIENWQSQPIEDQEEYLNIPDKPVDGIPTELNSYQRRLVYQIVQNEFPAMKTQGMGHFIQITNPSSEQQESQRAIQEQQRERDLSRAVGLRWVIDGMMGKDISKISDDYLLPALPIMNKAFDGDASVKKFLEDLQAKLKNRRKILVGHNCMTDIMFFYKMAIGVLPETLSEFVDHVHDMFPAIIDTKSLCSSYSERYGRQPLGDVERDLREDTTGPEMFTPSDFDRYINDAYLHEAGYDSYITAIVAIKMSSKLLKDGSMRKKDHDRQQEEVAKAAAASPPDFGVQDGYVTATECTDSKGDTLLNTPNGESNTTVSTPTMATAPSTLFGARANDGILHTHNHTNSIASTFSNDSALSASDMASSPSSVVAVRSLRDDQKPSQSIDWKDETQVAELRSVFASSSIYETLDSSSPAMPGEKPSEDADPAESTKERMDKLVRSGKMMPRWAEEGAFWDVYGNKLQVNGTVEGVLKLVE